MASPEEATTQSKVYKCKKCGFGSNSHGGMVSHSWVHRKKVQAQTKAKTLGPDGRPVSATSEVHVSRSKVVGRRACGKCHIGFCNVREYNRHYHLRHLRKPIFPDLASTPVSASHIPDYIKLVKNAREMVLITNCGSTPTTIDKIVNKIVHTLLKEA